MLRLYRLLLRLYPAWYVKECGDELLFVLKELQKEHRADGFLSRVSFHIREMLGLLVGALRERVCVRNQKVSGGIMKSFRFPRGTIVVLLVLLIGVMIEIEKARAAASQLAGVTFHPVWWHVPVLVVTPFMIMGGVGAIGYGVVHMFRMSRRPKDRRVLPGL